MKNIRGRGKLNVVPVAILALIILILIIARVVLVNAEEIETGDPNIYHWEINDNDSWVEMNKITGSITISMKSYAAKEDTKVRYQTIGFKISRSPSEALTIKKGDDYYAGYESPSDVGKFILDGAEKIDKGTKDGWNTTWFVFSNGYIYQELGAELSDLKGPTTIYLHAIFQSYKLNSDGSKIIRESNIDSWEEMLFAESWGGSSLSGFYKYYNIPLEFNPGPQPAEVYFDYKQINGVEDELYQKMIGNGFNIGTAVNWSSGVSETFLKFKEIPFALLGCYVKPIRDNSVIDGQTEWYLPSMPLDQRLATLKSKTAIMPWGGMEVHFVYSQVKPEDMIYDNFLYYQYKGTQRQAAKLAPKKINETLTWSAEVDDHPVTEVFGTGQYYLQACNIFSADGRTLIEERTVSDNMSADQLINGYIIEKEGGLQVVLYYTTDNPDPPISPTPIPSVTPKPTIPPTELPEGGQEVKPMNISEAIGEIRADVRGSERFNVLMGIPTTESLYAQVRGTEYILGYKLTKNTVRIIYPIKVTAIYHLKWTDAKNKTEIKTLDVPVEQIVDVKRACAYWEIEQFDYYTLNRATVYNGALPGGKCIMYPSPAYYFPPSLVINHSVKQEDHIIPPSQAKDGIKMDIYPPTGDGAKPIIPKDDFTYEANVGTDKIKVKSDYLSFNGRVIMDNSIFEFQAPALTNLNVLGQEPILSSKYAMYQPNQVIPALTLNDVYYSTGTLTYYNHPSAVNSSGYTYDIMIKNLNNVIVHTPVICDASITTQNSSTGITTNDPYVQTLNVDSSCLQLVIDPESTLSDFTVDINNYGKHLYIPGYCTRDFAWGVRDPSVSYIANKNSIYRNEVRFQFDVYLRRSSGDDTFIAKNTWIRFGFDTPTFYLPMWVDEGIYTVDFRTIAVNGVNTEDQLSRTQTYANTDRKNYVATDSIRVQVSGRLYGLTIYDVSDYPTWETVFRTADGSADFKINEGYPSGVTNTSFNAGYAYDYTIGTSNQYGIPTGRLNQYTLPFVNGSHPKYKNVGILKTGYAVKFKITTTGNAFSAGDNIHIVPRFYYVDADGKNRREVDIYYTEGFGGKNHDLVKMGSTLDLTNIKNYRCGDPFFGLPDNFLKIMADLTKTSYNSYKWKMLDLFTYTSIRMRWPLMAYTNIDYLSDVKNSSQLTAIRSAGVTDTEIIRRMQTFYGEYYFPADIKAVEKGFDVYGYASKYGAGENEAFWLKGGYIIVNFDIVTEDSNGNKNLSYINSVNAAKGYCSMWSMENPVTYKVSYNGKKDKATEFNFLPGDFMVYYTDKSLHDDYDTYIVK